MRQQERLPSPSMVRVFNYWKDKCITDEGDVHIEGAYPYDRSVAVIEDWGEPTCFACGRFLLKKDYYLGGQYEHDMELARWEKHVWSPKHMHGAQLAHIVPHSCGGTHDPENYFVLCPVCHQESPDTAFEYEFFRWVYNRRHEGPGFMREIDYALDELKNEKVDVQLGDMELSPEIARDVFSKITTHGAVMQPSTLVTAIKQFVKVSLNSDNDFTCQALDHAGEQSADLVTMAYCHETKLIHLAGKKRYKVAGTRPDESKIA